MGGIGYSVIVSGILIDTLRIDVLGVDFQTGEPVGVMDRTHHVKYRNNG